MASKSEYSAHALRKRKAFEYTRLTTDEHTMFVRNMPTVDPNSSRRACVGYHGAGFVIPVISVGILHTTSRRTNSVSAGKYQILRSNYCCYF